MRRSVQYGQVRETVEGGLNYYERHIGDYLKDTAHLSLLEHGIYTRLLDVYYTKECALQASEVARLIGARSREEKSALEAVLQEFFVLQNGAHAQPRCDREIERYKEKQNKARSSANARWNKDVQHTERNANAMRTHSEGNAPNHQTPVTSNQTPVVKTARGSRLPADFDLDFQFAVDQGIPNTLEEAHKFRDYWNSQPGQKGVKTDWQATWRNWCRNARTTGKPTGTNKQTDLENRNRAVADAWLRNQEQSNAPV